MGIDEQLVREIVRRVTSVHAARRIIVFGSAATDSMTGDSDIDLLVVGGPVEDPWEVQTRVRQALRGLPYPFDVVLMSEARFEETKDLVGGLAYPASRQGHVIYDAA